MAWIKRNLFFVISMAVGLILTGGAGYFVYTAIAANAEARDQTTSAAAELDQLQKKTPPPTDENIKIANEDSARVAQLAKDLGSAFVNFPTPPRVGPQDFIKYLNASLNQFRTAASNANVELVSPDYAFSFGAQANTLSFNEANFGPWMEQMEEIKAIMDILCAAKINSLDQLQRAPGPVEETTGTDLLPALITSNQVAIMSPYKIAFRGFSEEIANVLEGFGRSGHCFLIKDLQVSPSKSVPQGAGMAQISYSYTTSASPQPTYQAPMRPGMPPPPRGRGGRPPPIQMQPTPETVAATPVPTGPVTILKPLPLFVTMSIEVVRLKNTQH